MTTISAETARNFGFSIHPDAKVRYERADEFIEVVQKLWDSWEDDAFFYDKESGHFFEAAKQHEPLRQGKYFNVQGALNVSRPPQGYPVHNFKAESIYPASRDCSIIKKSASTSANKR